MERELGKRTVPVEKAIPSEQKSVDLEHLSHWLDKYDGKYALGACSCRRSRRMRDEGCLVYRRSESELKADREEIEDALAEGMELKLLRAPAEITGRDGKVAATRAARSRKSRSKRRRPAALAAA